MHTSCRFCFFFFSKKGIATKTRVNIGGDAKDQSYRDHIQNKHRLRRRKFVVTSRNQRTLLQKQDKKTHPFILWLQKMQRKNTIRHNPFLLPHIFHTPPPLPPPTPTPDSTPPPPNSHPRLHPTPTPDTHPTQTRLWIVLAYINLVRNTVKRQ